MLTFRQYFNHKQRFLQLQRGVCHFTCRRQHAVQYSEKLTNLSIAAQMIRLSDFLTADNPEFSPDNTQELILYNDVTPEQFYSIAEQIMKNLFTQAFHQGKTVSMFCESGFDEWMRFPVRSDLLHTDKLKLERLLYAEQFILNMRYVNFEVIPEENPDESETKLIFLPIQELLRLSKNHEKILIPTDSSCSHDLELDAGQKSKSVIFYSRFPNDNDLHAEKSVYQKNMGNTIFISVFQKPDHLTDLLRSSFNDIQTPIDSALQADPLQLSAVRHVNGPIRVLAPAGAGKTKVLISRIISLISIGVRPDAILALAFNKKAAEEMHNRLASHHIPVAGSLKDNGVVVRTFHSLGYELLREYAGTAFNPDEQQSDMRKILEEAVRTHSTVTHQRNIDALRPYQGMITRYKTELTDDSGYLSDPDKKDYPAIFRSMLDLQMKQGCMNYDDMLYQTIRFLLDDTEKRVAVQRRFEFVMVDEFQDLNLSQLWLMWLLSSPQDNLFVVGDDDQMIYGWRGAEVRHILDFENLYPTAVTCVLERNYRSHQAVIRHSRRLIDHNTRRVSKNIKPRDSAPEGSFTFELSDSLTTQAMIAADRIQAIHKETGCRWSDIAVLYRYHVYQAPVAMALDRLNIPHTPVSYRHLFLTHPGKDLYSYLSVILYPEKATAEDYHRIMKRPNKFITNLIIHSVRDQKTFLDSVNKSTGQEKPACMLKWFVESVSNLQNEVRRQHLKASDLIGKIDSAFKLTAFYSEYGQPANERDQAGDDVIWEVMVSLAQSIPETKEFFDVIRRAIHEEPQETHDLPGQDQAQLTTIHRTKGNEYRHVVYYNLSDRAHEDPTQIEEERRVCYVAVTRAIENIFITAPKKHFAVFLPELALDPAFSKISDRQLKRLAYRELKLLKKFFHQSGYEFVFPQKKIRKNNYPEWIKTLEETANTIQQDQSLSESQIMHAIKLIVSILQRITEQEFRRKLGRQKTIKLIDLFRKK